MFLKENYVSILSLKFGPSKNSLTKQETPLCITEIKEMLFFKVRKNISNIIYFFFSICICVVWICLNMLISVCLICLDTIQENHENWEKNSKNVYFLFLLQMNSHLIVSNLKKNYESLLASHLHGKKWPVQVGVDILSCQFQQLKLLLYLKASEFWRSGEPPVYSLYLNRWKLSQGGWVMHPKTSTKANP